MAQVVSCWLFTASHFSLRLGYFIWDLWWTKQRWKNFSPNTSIFTFTYFSTDAPYSFIYRRSHIISVTRLTTPPSPPKRRIIFSKYGIKKYLYTKFLLETSMAVAQRYITEERTSQLHRCESRNLWKFEVRMKGRG